jgi:hypothetical protein
MEVLAQFDLHVQGFARHVRRFVGKVEHFTTSSRLAQVLRSHEGAISLLMCAIFWGGSLTYAGTVTSGYHLVDDSRMVRINQDLKMSNPFVVAADTIRFDLRFRFRPIYRVYQVFSLWLFGANFIALSILLLGQAICSSWFLYLFSREMGFGSLSSLLFVALAFLGTQTEVWWRLGPQESLGIFWLALGLLFMARAASGPKTPRIQTLVAVVAFILASLTKESFIVLLPVVMLWWLMLCSHKTGCSAVGAIRRFRIPIMALGITCVVELATIFLKVGTTGIGYAGTDWQSVTLRNVLGTAKSLVMLTNPILTFSLLSAVAVLLATSIALTHGNLKQKAESHFDLLVELALVGSLVLFYTTSQAVLYAKSGFQAHYLVPGTVILSFLAIYLIAKVQQLIRPIALRFATKTFFIAAALASATTQYGVAIAAGKTFTQDGIALHQALDKADTSTARNDVIVIVADPAYDYEESRAMQTYFNILFRRDNVFIYPVLARPKETYSQFYKDVINQFSNRIGDTHIDNLADKSNIKTIFTLTRVNTDQAFRQNPPYWFDNANFVRSELGQFVLYTTAKGGSN